MNEGPLTPEWRATDVEIEKYVVERTEKLESIIGMLREELLQRQEADDALRSSESFLASIIDQSPYPMWISDCHGTLKKLNLACRELLHISDRDVVGKYNIFNDEIVEMQGMMPLVRTVFDEGATVRFELSYDSKQIKHLDLHSHTFVLLDVTVFPIRDGKGSISGAVIQHIDITARRESENALQRVCLELEQRVQERTAELTATNLALTAEIAERRRAEEKLSKMNTELERRVKDRTKLLESTLTQLETFSYSVSHDLRAPLRAMDGYLQMMASDFGPKLPPEVQPFLDKVSSNVTRMGKMIEDLLRFSRLSRHPLEKQMVDIGSMVLEIFDELRLERGGRCVDFTVADLPPCQADPALLRQILSNLLSNAIKYTRHTEVARIEVGSNVTGGKTSYFVRDNGAGFDMQYAGNLFGVFQRLHSAQQFEGAGVGLAIVRNIVQRHGGTVWGHGIPGAGAEFSFVL